MLSDYAMANTTVLEIYDWPWLPPWHTVWYPNWQFQNLL